MIVKLLWFLFFCKIFFGNDLILVWLVFLNMKKFNFLFLWWVYVLNLRFFIIDIKRLLFKYFELFK